MQLANDLKRALGKRRAHPYKANGYAVGIKQGKIRLSHLQSLARQAKCSLTYLTSGGNYEAKEDLLPKEAVRRSVMHKGYDHHDFARMLGYRNYNVLAKMLEDSTIPVKLLMKIANTLDMEIWELLCDGNYEFITPLNLEPSYWNQMVELNIMGWLDAKQRDKYNEENGPGI